MKIYHHHKISFFVTRFICCHKMLFFSYNFYSCHGILITKSQFSCSGNPIAEAQNAQVPTEIVPVEENRCGVEPSKDIQKSLIWGLTGAHSHRNQRNPIAKA